MACVLLLWKEVEVAKKKELSPGFLMKLAQGLELASPEERLRWFIPWIRSLESEASRDAGQSKALKASVCKDLGALGIDEFQVCRTMAVLSPDTSIPKDARGAAKLEELRLVFGRRLVSRLVQCRKRRVQEIVYELTPEAEDILNQMGRYNEFIHLLGNTPKLRIGPIPKRAIRGKTREKKRRRSRKP